MFSLNIQNSLVADNLFFSDHWHDILVGCIVGYVLAYFSYRQYYPSLASPFSHRPYSPRIAREDDEEAEGLPTHRRPGGDQSHRPSQDEIINDDVELADGTVQRPGPSHLSDAWREDGTGYKDPLVSQ